MPVHKRQNMQKALRLRKNTFFSVHLFPYCKRVIFVRILMADLTAAIDQYLALDHTQSSLAEE